ncbi:hypothetical protein ASG90_05775 [Nocardioides sp. Soil797]|nr:hypothetical protein ASG90_05775 [Nocardioides sp. Soil797]
MTFVRACSHLTNFTSAHESRAGRIGDRRFAYPEDHIEVDNRLSWFLGGLGKAFDGSDVLYVHLQRDPEAVAKSFLKRWDSSFRPSMIRAFGHGLTQRSKDWPEKRRLDVCRHYVDTVTDNIEDFMRGRPGFSVQLETIESDFNGFLDRIGGEGDRDAAMAEWGVRHNASRVTNA